MRKMPNLEPPFPRLQTFWKILFVSISFQPSKNVTHVLEFSQNSQATANHFFWYYFSYRTIQWKCTNFFTQINLCFFPPQNSREMSIFCPGLLLPFSLRENVCFSKDTNSARQTDRLLTDRWLTDRLLTDRLLTDWRTDRRTDRRTDAGIGGGDSFL